MKGGRCAYVVGGKRLLHHIKVFAHLGVHANADAGIGNHHIRHALAGDAGFARRNDTVANGDIGAINLIAA